MGGVGKLFGGFAFVFVHPIYLRWWSQLTRLGLFRAARSANQTMQIYGNTVVQDGSTRFAARCSLFFDSIYNILYIYIYWHDIDVRYSIMYIYIYILYIYTLILKGPRNEGLSKGPRNGAKDLKGPQRTSKDLKGPQRTSGDLRGPPMWTWDNLRPFRLEIEGTMHKIIDWNDNDIQDRTISFKMIAWHENIIEDLYDGLKHPSAKWAHEQCLNSPLKESRA